jgi:hypothetical protein
MADNKQEQIGFHKGSVATLVKERQELVRIISIIDQLMQGHVKALKDLGVDLEKEAKEAQKKLEKANTEKLDDRIA